jgi:hypothetical protein
MSRREVPEEINEDNLYQVYFNRKRETTRDKDRIGKEENGLRQHTEEQTYIYDRGIISDQKKGNIQMRIQRQTMMTLQKMFNSIHTNYPNFYDTTS